MPDPAALLANRVFSEQGIIRFQNLVLAWRALPKGPPTLDISTEDPIGAAAMFYQLSVQLDRSSALQALLSKDALIRANQCIDRAPPELRAKGSKCVVDAVYERFGGKGTAPKTFRNRLSAASSLNKNCGELIPYLFEAGCKSDIAPFEVQNTALQSILKAHLHYGLLSRPAKELLKCIREGGEHPPRIWESHPFGQELLFEHRAELLGLETLPPAYRLDDQGHIVTVQPIIPTPLLEPTPPSTVAEEDEADEVEEEWTEAESKDLIEQSRKALQRVLQRVARRRGRRLHNVAGRAAALGLIKPVEGDNDICMDDAGVAPATPATNGAVAVSDATNGVYDEAEGEEDNAWTEAENYCLMEALQQAVQHVARSLERPLEAVTKRAAVLTATMRRTTVEGDIRMDDTTGPAALCDDTDGDDTSMTDVGAEVMALSSRPASHVPSLDLPPFGGAQDRTLPSVWDILGTTKGNDMVYTGTATGTATRSSPMQVFATDASNTGSGYPRIPPTALTRPGLEAPGHGVDTPTSPPIDSLSITATPALESRVARVFKQRNFDVDSGPQLASEICRQLVPTTDEDFCPRTDMQRLRDDGFIHWEDPSVGRAAKHLQKTTIFDASGLEILRLILVNRRLQQILRCWFNRRPFVLAHCKWWGSVATEYPIFLKQNSGHQNDRHLGVHILPNTSKIRYYAGSHKKIGPEQRDVAWFTCTQSVLEEEGYHPSDRVSNGFTVFDPTISHQFEGEDGWGITVVFVTDELNGWVQLDRLDPPSREVLKKMEQVDGISWNLTSGFYLD